MELFELRAAKLEDQDILFRMHEEVFRVHIDQIWGWDDQWQIDNFRKEWREVDTTTIYQTDNLVGYMQLRVKPDHIYIQNLAICQQYQNKKIGSELIEQLKCGNRTLRLSVFKTNHRALSFYIQHGFKITKNTQTGFKLEWELQKE